jgi:lysophospholipase L1-like esterase
VGRAVRSGIIDAAFLAGAVCLPLLAGEAACRLAGYRSLEQYRPDSEIGWAPAPGQITVTRVGSLPVRVNVEAFRGGPLEQPKPAGTTRIFAVGASTTFGWGVREEETYHRVLERMLNDTARSTGAAVRYEIVNAGVIGFNLRQVSRYMQRIARRYQPDGFLVAYTFNDAWNRFGTAGAPSLGRILLGVRAKNVLRRSALYYWLVDLLARRRYAASMARGAGFAAQSQTGDGAVTAADLAEFRGTLDSMLALARGARLSLAFLVPAARGQGSPWPRQATMARVAADAHLPLLDLLPTSGPGSDDPLYLPGDAVHPSPRGHAVIARLLYAELCRAALTALSGSPEAIYLAGCGARPLPQKAPGAPPKERARIPAVSR